MTDASALSQADDAFAARPAMGLGGPGWRSTAIVAHDRILGWLCLLEDLGETDDKDREWMTALEEAVSIVTLEQVRLQRVIDVESASLQRLADELVADPASAVALALARALHYDLEGMHRVLTVHVDGCIADLEERRSLFEKALRKLNVRSPLVAEQGNRLFLILPWDQPPEFDDGPYLSDLVLALEGVVGSEVQVGVGTCCELAELGRSVDEAIFAIDTRDPLHAQEKFTVFQDLGFWRVLHDAGASLRLRQLVEEWIGGLIRLDASQPSELVKTLSVYLNLSCAIESAANALFIHRNTLRYRLAKIERVTGHDISDPEQRFQLELACRAWGVLQVLDAVREADGI